MSELLTIDMPRVTRDEAVELMLHHLTLAAAYFEATPDDQNAQALAELARLRLREGCGASPADAAAQAWLAAILNTFEEMKRND